MPRKQDDKALKKSLTKLTSPIQPRALPLLLILNNPTYTRQTTGNVFFKKEGKKRKKEKRKSIATIYLHIRIHINTFPE